MANIKLTNTERLILANQYEILSALKKDSSYERLSENLRNGHEWLYSQAFDWISENLSEEKAEHVLTILGIYGDMRDSYKTLSDKTGIEENEVVFPGFDGNNEAELLMFARALREDDRFVVTLGNTAQNSHFPTNEMYGRMIKKWEEIGKPNYPYTKQMILDILSTKYLSGSR